MLHNFNMNITVTYDEEFTHEVEDKDDVEEAREEAERFAEYLISDDLQMGDIPADSFDISVESELIESVEEK